MVIWLLILTFHENEITVDRVELNHWYNSSGHLVMDQLLWSHLDFKIIDYHKLKGVREEITKVQRLEEIRSGVAAVGEWRGPGPLQRNGFWVFEWFENGVFYRVKARIYLETWTPFDTEGTYEGKREGFKW